MSPLVSKARGSVTAALTAWNTLQRGTSIGNIVRSYFSFYQYPCDTPTFLCFSGTQAVVLVYLAPSSLLSKVLQGPLQHPTFRNHAPQQQQKQQQQEEQQQPQPPSPSQTPISSNVIILCQNQGV